MVCSGVVIDVVGIRVDGAVCGYVCRGGAGNGVGIDGGCDCGVGGGHAIVVLNRPTTERL